MLRVCFRPFLESLKSYTQLKEENPIIELCFRVSSSIVSVFSKLGLPEQSATGGISYVSSPWFSMLE